MAKGKKIIVALLTLIAIAFEIITLPLAYLLTLVFRKRLSNLNEENRKILLTSLSVYLLFFITILIIGTILFYVNQSLLVKYEFKRSFLFSMILYLILLKIVFKPDLKKQIDTNLNNLFIISQYFTYAIVGIFVFMTILSTISRELWAKWFDFLKLFIPLFVIPVYGLIKTKDVDTKWRFLILIIISYCFFMAINFSILLGPFTK